MKSIGQIALFLLVSVALTSCIYDEYPVEKEFPEFRDGYSLTLAVTLDRMGGTRVGGDIDRLKEIDDYIDPERFRVLFFDHREKFLFESKSRWIKQLAPTSDGYSQWLVSVPMYSTGNDVAYDWDWDSIRDSITTNKFKIAILANRPLMEWYPGFTETFEKGSHTDNAQWIDNSGPHWERKDMGQKSVFDLHHCQYDILYHAKGQESGYYDFIMGNWGKDENGDNTAKTVDMRPTMGATSSWVYWGEGAAAPDYKGVNPQTFDTNYPSSSLVKYTVLPDRQHPIPMYGIQEFEPIKNWVKGTPFNLSRITTGGEQQQTGYTFKSVALLRSLVRLELVLSKKSFPNRPDIVALFYSNIYARCEPMNVWDPTDLIWEDDHENACEWNDIMDYGLVCSKDETLGGTQRYTATKAAFQKTMSWFYGEWLKEDPDGKPRWTFPNYTGGSIVTNIKPKHPKIFNTCIQRNKMVICNKEGDLSDDYDDGFWHFVVYTGERNMIDPNNIPVVNGTTYAISWLFKGGDNKYYTLPIADYNTETTNKHARSAMGPWTAADIGSSNSLPPGSTTKTGGMFQYSDKLRDEVTSRDEMPWPLLRNHIYRITMGPSTRAGEDFSLTSEDVHSQSLRSIDF